MRIIPTLLAHPIAQLGAEDGEERHDGSDNHQGDDAAEAVGDVAPSAEHPAVSLASGLGGLDGPSRTGETGKTNQLDYVNGITLNEQLIQ